MNVSAADLEKGMVPLSERVAPVVPVSDPNDVTLLAFLNALLMRRRLIIVLALTGAVIGFLAGFLSKRTYTSAATFIPQGNEGSPQLDLALAASQFGLRIPGSNGAWAPAVYVDLVRSRDLLAPIVTLRLNVPEERRQASLIELLEVKAPTEAERIERAIIQVRNFVRSRESRSLGAVELAVTTRWPSVSYQIADGLVKGVHQFNLEARRAQAAAERAFIEPLVRQSEMDLRAAEDRLAAFLTRNKIITGSAELTLQRERLERDVATHQELYNSILKKFEEARIGETRNTPVIMVVEKARRPILPNPRNSVLKAGIGGLTGTLIGLVIALLWHGLSAARSREHPEARRFFRLINEATPRVLRRTVQ